MISIPQPSMALNSTDVPGAPYKFYNTWSIGPGEPLEHIMGWVASVASSVPGGKLKFLVINCHGYYGTAPGGGEMMGGFGLAMGSGIRRADTSKFSVLRGKVRCIIITACGTARITIPGTSGDGDGNLFCSEIARYSGAYVIAGTTHQVGGIMLPNNAIDDFEGLVLRYTPRGGVDRSFDFGRNWIEGLINGWQ